MKTFGLNNNTTLCISLEKLRIQHCALERVENCDKREFGIIGYHWYQGCMARGSHRLP